MDSFLFWLTHSSWPCPTIALLIFLESTPLVSLPIPGVIRGAGHWRDIRPWITRLLTNLFLCRQRRSVQQILIAGFGLLVLLYKKSKPPHDEP